MRKSLEEANTLLPAVTLWIAVIMLTLVLIFALASCAEREAAAATPEFDKPTFYLSGLPELEPFEMPPEIAERYGGIAYADELIPRDDYGKLYPYIGKLIDFPHYEGTNRFGLCDEKGRVVVDPVYERAQYIDENYLLLSYPREKIDPAVTDVRDAAGTPAELIIVTADGSRIVGKFAGNYASISEDRLSIHSYGGGTETSEIYDLEGRLILKADGYFADFYEGLGVLHRAEESRSEYIDKDGRTVIPGPFVYAENFSGGKAVVAVAGDETASGAFTEKYNMQKYGVIDTEGEYLIEPVYGRIEAINNGGQVCYVFSDDTGLCGVMSEGGEIIIPARYANIFADTVGDFMSDIVIAEDAGGNGENRIFHVINLVSGEEKQIAGTGPRGESAEGNPKSELNVLHANPMGGGWYQVDYFAETGYIEAIVLVKDDKEYRFESDEGGYLFCAHIKEDLFIISYYGAGADHGREPGRTEIFDGASGETVKTIDGLGFEYRTETGVTVLEDSDSNTSAMYAFDENFEPQFSAETLGGNELTLINQLTDDVYQVRTAFSSGLLKEDGEWLMRVNISSNTD